jgi:hypothetical protein
MGWRTGDRSSVNVGPVRGSLFGWGGARGKSSREYDCDGTQDTGDFIYRSGWEDRAEAFGKESWSAACFDARWDADDGWDDASSTERS